LAFAQTGAPSKRPSGRSGSLDRTRRIAIRCGRGPGLRRCPRCHPFPGEEQRAGRVAALPSFSKGSTEFAGDAESAARPGVPIARLPPDDELASTNLDSLGARRRETSAPPREARVANRDSAAAVLWSMPMHRCAFACSTVTADQIRGPRAFAQSRASGCRGLNDRFHSCAGESRKRWRLSGRQCFWSTATSKSASAGVDVLSHPSG
jgi:hypothetical protein